MIGSILISLWANRYSTVTPSRYFSELPWSLISPARQLTLCSRSLAIENSCISPHGCHPTIFEELPYFVVR